MRVFIAWQIAFAFAMYEAFVSGADVDDGDALIGVVVVAVLDEPLEHEETTMIAKGISVNRRVDISVTRVSCTCP